MSNAAIIEDMGFLKTARNTAIASLIILIVMTGAAILYLYFAKPTPTPQLAGVSSSAGSLLTPTPPGDNAKEGAAIQSITPTAKPGSNVAVVAMTNAASRCVITMNQSLAAKGDPALAAQIADAYGTVSWTWHLPSTANTGSASVSVSCTYHGRTGVVIGSFKVI